MEKEGAGGFTLILHPREVREPVVVRYAWNDDPAVNLVNSSGLPTLPFRSDAWSLKEAR